MRLLEFERRLDREIEAWPGATRAYTHRAKHRCLTLEFRGRTRSLIHPTTPGDHRGVLNKISEIRRTLTMLGAERGPRNKRC